MLNKIFNNPNLKYCFTINNTFHILYFLGICKKYKINDYLFLINNTNNFFIKGEYNKIFEKEKIKYICVSGEDSFRKFPYSIIDIIKYKREVKNKLKNIRGYNLIISLDSSIGNFLITKELSKKNYLLCLLDTSIYGVIDENNYGIKYKLYNLYLKALGIHKSIISGKYLKYKFKVSYKNIDKNILFDNISYLKNLFLNKLKSLNNIKGEKNIIFLSQNIIDEYGINKDLFINKLIKIQDIYKNKGFNFHIKPHPLENTFYYENKFNVIDKSIPSELLDIYFGDKETVYLTYFSTVINNLQFGKKYLIGDIGFGKNEKQIINMLNKDFNISFISYE